MNILLIYPKFPDTFWSFKHALKFIRKKASSPPLGLLTIAAMLPDDWQLKLVDNNVKKLTKRDLQWADYAFISGMTVQRDSAKKIIRQCKETNVKVVAGGPLFTHEYKDFQLVDHFVLNEAEITLPQFLEDLKAKKAQKIYKTSEFADITQTPTPRWDLIDKDHYASMSIQYSRGCPYDCDFCNITVLLGHKPRLKNADQIILELDSLYNSGWNGSIFFVDDNFIGNKKHLKKELLPALINWRNEKNGITFHTEASINLADDNTLIKMMVAAGFDKVFIGIETPDEASLAECNKKHNLNRNLVDDVKKLQKSGLQVQGGFIVGFDNDTSNTFNHLFEFIQKSGIVTAMVGILQAPPGTKLFARLKNQGRINDHISGDNVDGSTNVIPKMNLNELKKKYRSLIEKLYSPEQYYQRVKIFLEEYNLPKFHFHIDLKSGIENLLALFRSIFKLGILGKERFHYWKLFFWTLFNKPRLFPQAITFSIYGYHFRKISELHIQ